MLSRLKSQSVHSPSHEGFDALDIYRRMFATSADELSAWWYFGTSFVDIDGYPSVPVIQAETFMVYKLRTLSADAFRMDYWEIGYMRDPVTGEIADTWKNPITGQTVDAPRKFQEGPAHFIVERSNPGLKIALVQAHARIESVDVAFSLHDQRLQLQQVELKVRGFPLPDGSMPSLDSDHVSSARTRLSLFVDREELSSNYAPCSGTYEFELFAPPPWMGFGDAPGRNIVRGIMTKTPMDQVINPIAWDRLKHLFPECFVGDRIRPSWE